MRAPRSGSKSPSVARAAEMAIAMTEAISSLIGIPRRDPAAHSAVTARPWVEPAEAAVPRVERTPGRYHGLGGVGWGEDDAVDAH